MIKSFQHFLFLKDALGVKMEKLERCTSVKQRTLVVYTASQAIEALAIRIFFFLLCFHISLLLLSVTKHITFVKISTKLFKYMYNILLYFVFFT